MNLWNASGANFQFIDDPASAVHVAAYNMGRFGGRLALTQTVPLTPGSYLTGRDVLVNLWFEFTPSHPSLPHTDSGGAYDLQTIAAHELGHLLHLGEDFSGSATMMKPKIKPGEVRQLHPDDVAGIKYLYP